MPDELDVDHISAKLAKGVLTAVLPKTEAVKDPTPIKAAVA